MFDFEELKGSVQATRVVVAGDFTVDLRIAGSIRDGFFVPDSEAFELSGASKVASTLSQLGFNVVASGLVPEEDSFLSLQEILYVNKVNVSGLKSALGLPSNVVRKYSEESKRVLTSGNIDTGGMTRNYLEYFKESLAGAAVCVFVESPYRSMPRDVMIEALDIARKQDVRTVIIPHAKGFFEQDSRYFHGDFVVASMEHILRLVKSFKITDSAKIGISDLEKLGGTCCSGAGSLIGYGNSFFVSSKSEIFKVESNIQLLPALAVVGVALSMGYRFDQAAYFASKIRKGVSMRKLMSESDGFTDVKETHH